MGEGGTISKPPQGGYTNAKTNPRHDCKALPGCPSWLGWQPPLRIGPPAIEIANCRAYANRVSAASMSVLLACAFARARALKRRKSGGTMKPLKIALVQCRQTPSMDENAATLFRYLDEA